MTALCRLLCPLLLTVPLIAQQTGKSILVYAATATDKEDLDRSISIIDKVKNELEGTGGFIEVGYRLARLGDQLSDEEMVSYTREQKADGAATLHYESVEGQTSGLAHLRVIKIADPIQYRYAAEQLNPANIATWQIVTLAGTIARLFQPREYIRVEVLMYTKPKNSYFRVGGGQADSTSEPGRGRNEGFKRWSAILRPGKKNIEVYKDSTYQRLTNQIIITEPKISDVCNCVFEAVLSQVSAAQKSGPGKGPSSSVLTNTCASACP